MAELKRKLNETIAEHLTDRVMDVLDDFYEHASVDPKGEDGLRERILQEMRVQVSDVV